MSESCFPSRSKSPSTSCFSRCLCWPAASSVLISKSARFSESLPKRSQQRASAMVVFPVALSPNTERSQPEAAAEKCSIPLKLRRMRELSFIYRSPCESRSLPPWRRCIRTARQFGRRSIWHRRYLQGPPPRAVESSPVAFCPSAFAHVFDSVLNSRKEDTAKTPQSSHNFLKVVS